MCLGPCPSCLRMFGFGLCVLGWESGSWLVGNNMGRSSAIWVMGSGWVRPFTKPILVAIGPWAAMSLGYSFVFGTCLEILNFWECFL